MPFYNKIKSKFNIVTSFTGNPESDFSAFAEGYHEAANSLAKNFLSKNGYADFEGYPIVFLYRHSFELYLKGIIYQTILLCAFKNIKNINSKLYNTHGLKTLSDISTKLLKILFPKDKYVKKIIDVIETTAKEYDFIDSTSSSYRYPIDKNGKYPTKNSRVVNISSIYKHMDKLLSDLEGLNFGLEMEIDNAAEAYELLKNFTMN